MSDQGGTTTAAGGPVLAVLLAAFAVCLSILPLETPDVWFHLAAGRLMVDTGTWPQVNTFSFTAPDHPWIDLHWGFQLLLYAAYVVAGPNGCIALVALLVLATAGVSYAVTRRFVSPAVAALLVAVALLIASPRFLPRPELVSFLLIAVYVALLDAYPRSGRLIYLLVPLQIVWTNAQGIYVLGLVLIGCYWAGATLAALPLPLPRGWRAASGCDPPAWRRLTLVLVLAAVACLLNPYGLAGARFPLQLLATVSGDAVVSPRIAEFRSPFTPGGYAPLVVDAWLALLAATAIAFALNWRHWHVGRLLVVLAFGYLSTLAIRNMALFAWVAVPALAANAAGWYGARRRSAPPATRAERRRKGAREPTSPAAAVRDETRARGPGAGVAAAAAVLAMLIAAVVTNHLWRVLGVQREFGLGVSGLRFSEQAMAFADEAGIGGRPFNCLALGGFLLWHVGPEGKVFVDGRLEAYPESVFREYFGVMDVPATWPELAQARAFDYALIYHGFGRLPVVYQLVEEEGWVVAYHDQTVSLLLPGDEAHRAVRERAAAAFAKVQAARAAAPPRVRTALDAIRVPIIEIESLRQYGDFLEIIGQDEQALEVRARADALDAG